MSIVEIGLRILCFSVPVIVIGLAFRRSVQSHSPNIILYVMNGGIAGFALVKSGPAMLPQATPAMLDIATGLLPLAFWGATVLILGHKTHSKIRYRGQNEAAAFAADHANEIQLSSLLPNPAQGANSEA